ASEPARLAARVHLVPERRVEAALGQESPQLRQAAASLLAAVGHHGDGRHRAPAVFRPAGSAGGATTWRRLSAASPARAAGRPAESAIAPSSAPARTSVGWCIPRYTRA